MSDYVNDIKNNWFKNHQGIIKQHGNILKINWHDKTGIEKYNISYILDGKFVYIISNLGNVALNLNEKAALELLTKYSLRQFSRKVRYREDKEEEFEPEIAVENIEKYKNENSDLKQSIVEFFDTLTKNANKCSNKKDWMYQVNKIKVQYGMTFFDYNWLYEAGSNYCLMLVAYWIGLKMVYKQTLEERLTA